MALPEAFAEVAHAWRDASGAFEFSVRPLIGEIEDVIVRVHVVRKEPARAALGRYGPRGGWRVMGVGGHFGNLRAQERVLSTAADLVWDLERMRLKAEKEGWA